MCRSSEREEQTRTDKAKGFKRQQGKKTQKGRPLRFVEEETESDEEYAFAVGSQNETVTVFINDKPISMIVDSGASINIINTKAAKLLKKSGCAFEKSNKKVHPYGSPPIKAT